MTNIKNHEQQHHTEILKAAAQAWHGHSSGSRSSTSTTEYDAHRLFFKSKPTRFKLEATDMASKKEKLNSSWDFGQSLWDSYEIVSVSKKLERGLILGNPFSALEEQEHFVKKTKEKKNSLRYLFRVSSRRFSAVDLTSGGE